jgi:hypothetical protein
MELRRRLLRAIIYPFAWPIIGMPGRSYGGSFAALSQRELTVRRELERTLRKLAEEIGERNDRKYAGLQAGEEFIASEFSACGYPVTKQSFQHNGVEMNNVIAEKRGTRYPHLIVVVGAHHDTVYGTGGADDNTSGVSALLAIAWLLKDRDLPFTLRLVAFANEENQNSKVWEDMGSYRYAKLCHDRGDQILGMVSLEMLGYYSDEPGSQQYPSPFNLLFPDVGNFIGFVGNLRSRAWVRKCIGSFRERCRFPSEGAAVPERFRDIARSDHWSFWQFNWPALMVTDTSNFRNRLYHTVNDTPAIIDFDRLARLTVGLSEMVADLCS